MWRNLPLERALRRRAPVEAADVQPRRRATLLGSVVGVAVVIMTTIVIPQRVSRVLIPETLMLCGVIGAALIGRFAAGLLTAIVATAALSYWYLDPHEALFVDSTADIVSAVLFVGTALALTTAISTLARRALNEARERAHSEAQAEVGRAAIRALQSASVPDRLSSVPGVTLCCRYLPASTETGVGGDWFTTVPLDGGRVGLAIGDVAGHGIVAAAQLAEVQSSVRALAAHGLSPAALLSSVNDLLSSSGERFVTTLYGVLDPQQRVWRHANAGHCPPLLRDADGSVSVLDGRSQLPLGVESAARFTEREVAVEPGSVLVLYTDGLVERRGESLDDGIARLSAEVKRLDTFDEPAVDQLIRAMSVDAIRRDDVAVLCATTLAEQTHPAPGGDHGPHTAPRPPGAHPGRASRAGGAHPRP